LNENASLAAVKNVPIWTQGQLNSDLSFIKELIILIPESGLKEIKRREHLKVKRFQVQS